MTDVGRMRVQELVDKVLADEHADVLRQAVGLAGATGELHLGVPHRRCSAEAEG
jgi:hypothetical protein